MEHHHHHHEHERKFTIPTYVINLRRREDRRKRFIENNGSKIQFDFFDAFDAKGEGLTYDGLKQRGFDTNQTWKDPQDGQHLSYGGVGCFISHFWLWQRCIKLNHPIMILEDDVIIEDEFDCQEILDLLIEGYNLVYPGYAEQGTAKPVKGKTGLVIPDYPYWASSYAITPEAAKILVNDEIKQNIIPVDEYITTKLPELNPIGYEKRIIHQIPKDGTSDVDPHWGRDRSYFQDYHVHSFNNDNEGVESLAEFVHELPDNDVVIYYADESKFKKYVENEIGRKFLYTSCGIIKREEDAFMPNLAEGKDDFNSEVYVARVSWIKKMLSHSFKKYVINLEHRKDRKEVFENNNSEILGEYEFSDAVNGYELSYNELKEYGYDVNHDWIDPILKTPLTKGEVGCFLSHYSLWVECIEKNETFIIFEDDAIVTDRFNELEIQSLLHKNYNFIYLGWKEMLESKNLNDTFVIPKYPYWGLAYVITPEAAKVLVKKNIEKSIIPVDEYLPTMMDKLRPIAYNVNVVNARSREDAGSNINPNNCYDYYVDFDVHAITVGTDESKCSKLYESASYSNIEFTNIGKDVIWHGGEMEKGKGGGQKINLLREHLKTLPNDDVVLFCDAYDVFLNSKIEEFAARYLGFKKKVVFAAESSCWPDDTLAASMEELILSQFGGYDTPYKYLNSGIFMGRVSELKRIVGTKIKNDGDDQLYYQKKWLSEKYDMIIDTDNYMFQCHEQEVRKGDNGMLYNPRTQCFNLCYHGNGGEDAKTKFNQLYSSLYASSSPIVYIPTHNYTKLKDDILLIPFLTPSMCDSIIELSERHGGYKNDEGDDVPGQEIRLHEIGLSEKLEFHWQKCIAPMLNEEFNPCAYYGIRDAFIIKYTMEGQRDLRLHSDASLVTGSIKLNNEYTGGELYFPRQDLSNKDIPVGDCILFPGQVSHPHTSKELESGTKFSLTIWTKRNKND